MHGRGSSGTAEDRGYPVGCRPACLVLSITLAAMFVMARAHAQSAPAAPATSQASTFSPNTAQTPAKPVSPEERADIFMARKAYADAIDYYRRALKRDAANAGIWNKLGIAYQLQMDYRDARKSYKESTHKQADFAEPWNNLGTTYYLQGKYRRSVKYYTHAVELGPGAASFHLNLGAAYSQMKKFPEAIQQYRQALKIDPNVLTEHSSTAAVVQARGADVEFYFCLAKAFASLARPDDSVRFLRRALEDGFKDFKRLDDDPDFQKISKYPAYVELRKNLPVAIPD